MFRYGGLNPTRLATGFERLHKVRIPREARHCDSRPPLWPGLSEEMPTMKTLAGSRDRGERLPIGRYSILMLARRMTSPHFSRSAAMCAWNASGVPRGNSVPCEVKRWRTSAGANALRVSAFT